MTDYSDTQQHSKPNPAPIGYLPDDAKVWDRAVENERARIERIIEAHAASATERGYCDCTEGFCHDLLATIRGGDDA